MIPRAPLPLAGTQLSLINTKLETSHTDYLLSRGWGGWDGGKRSPVEYL